MSKVIGFMLLITVAFSLPAAYAEDAKCIALGNLTETLYRNSSTTKEYQTLRSMELKSTPIDFAFIKFYAGVAYSGKKFNSIKLKNDSINFCQKFVMAAVGENINTYKSRNAACPSLVQNSKIINTFKTSGDTRENLSKLFNKTFGGSSLRDRLLSDYFDLLIQIKYTSLFDTKTDEEFMNFSSKTCDDFLDYAMIVDAAK